MKASLSEFLSAWSTGIRQPDTAAVKKAHDDSKFIYHNLKPGETIYSLSKVYGVSENEIIQSNPGIEISLSFLSALNWQFQKKGFHDDAESCTARF